VTGPGNPMLKSLSPMLRGKQGRFRQNILAKSVDYSGRSVIAAGRSLEAYKCGFLSEKARELYKPSTWNQAVAKGIAHESKWTKRKIERVHPDVWDVLEEVIKEHAVL